ncbi:cullin binding protein CanA [Metarhizium acridum CQMa 102]|uniref:Cullin binding protein CanA n=1 Tax=Metarhizium acridum (strain CQMa 102) TaxID=655827 RepID=E9E814_METAQ|nr:cullin binding protein CanA [Metarhizium acridum CQMa 102]EFY87885.1 cullin binding protein CanA [Metarhizium acridum CQMa 102]
MAATANINPTPQSVTSLISKLGDADPDFRFMSLNDLLHLLNIAKPDFLQHDYNTAARAVDSIIKTLDDQNGEVQNMAIKCVAPLVGKVPMAIIAPMIDKLSSMVLKNSVDNAVTSLALRSVIIALPRPVPGIATTPDVQQSYDAIRRVLIPRLIGPNAATPSRQTTDISLPLVPAGMLQGDDASPETVDVLIEVVRCFGPLLQSVEVEAMQHVVMQLLESNRHSSVVKKRAVVAISMLAVYLADEHLRHVIQRLASRLSDPSTGAVSRRLYISIIGSMARSIPVRFGPHIASTVPLMLKALSEEELQDHLERLSDGEDIGIEFNEVREAALVSVEAFLASCPQEMRPFTDDIIAATLRYLKYDPNYAVDEEDDDVDMDEDEDQEDEDDGFDADDGFEDDDDDASWKVRRCAAKALYTLISTRGSGDLLDNGVLYSQAAPSLIKRIDEREENVRLEIISALALLIRKTGEGLHVANFSLDDTDPPVAVPAPLNRKRRRQSSAGTAMTVSQFMAGSGLTSPVLERVPTTGPRADLAQLTPGIVKASIKQLKGKTVPTKQSIINLLDDIVLVQRGGLALFFPDLIGPVLDAAKSTGHGATASSLASAGGSASATLSTLRIATLRLISDISKTHSSSVLQPYLTKIVAGVINAVHDRFYKISSEAIRTAEELVKTITPPRSRNSGSKFKAELESLYEVLMDKGSANDADAEVRQRAIHALGVLISRTFGDGSNLLSPDKRMKALNILRERLKNETTRLAAVRAVDNVAAFASSPDELERGWIQDVALELSAQLRKANRSLRGSSVNALKHLILSKAAQGQLEKQTVDGVVSALMPAVTNSDTHLLGPALVILASLTPSHADVTVSKDLVAALCQLLKSHFAGIALDQLLELVARIGESGASHTLMQGLLKDVSISGDPSVVGKVIGTLLVTGDTSAGVSVDSFISELENSSKIGDEARVSLALAVLGETGMRLGSSSPMRPDLFLRQFHPEPDKVSLAAAIALGRAGSGNASEFLPVILEKMQAGGNTQYLLIQSIKEILQSIPVQSVDIREYAVPIWDQLRQASEAADNRVVCAECVGRLVILDPGSFMTKLQVFLLIKTEIFFVANSYQALLKDTSSGIRGMAVQAVRYALSESEEAFDTELKNYLIDMLLVMLQDTDTEIRRLAMSTLNSAAHNKPDLILPHLGELMPFVLGESIIKPELVKEVMLGPFKHTVDDGLEVRKSAYETLYALMETAFTRINNIDFYDRVVAGLKDDNDIRQLCNLMVSKLIVIDPDETARRLDSIAEAYRGVLSIKLKDNAVKQDVEKQEEANKSVLRVTLLLGDKMKAMTGNAGAVTSNAGAAGIWTSYWEWANKEFEKQLKGLREESKELQSRMV